MAILSQNCIQFIEKVFFSDKVNRFVNFENDPILSLADYCMEPSAPVPSDYFENGLVETSLDAFKQEGIVGVIRNYFNADLFYNKINPVLERKIVLMKSGLEALPATKASILFKGFGLDISVQEVLLVYASYGLTNKQKKTYPHVDFFELNRYFQGLQGVLTAGGETIKNIDKLYRSIRSYHYENQKNKSRHIPMNMKRPLFYYYLRNIYQYGMLGLFPKQKSNIRQSKIGYKHESWMVIDKIQHPDKTEQYYIDYLKYNGVTVKRSVVNGIFRKWQVKKYNSAYISDLNRLKTEPEPESQTKEGASINEMPQIRYIDQNFLFFLRGLKANSLTIDAPGLFVLWHYLEKLGIFAELERLGLTTYNNGHSWMEFLLFNIARIFYGVDTYDAACKIEEPSIRFFASMIKTPCINTFLSRLSEIGENKLFELQKWLVSQLQRLQLSSGKQIVFDFNQIDLDVKNKRLRNFGAGPSPKKKICYSGFRPHIAWDADKGTLLVAEFRKSSARGTSTVRRFSNDYLMPVFKGFFEEVFIDSEYTGKNVWNYILDKNDGMGAELVGCIKQNPLVKKALNKFLIENGQTEDFWRHWDPAHVYSSKTFTINWSFTDKNNKNVQFELNCMVKKNLKNGKYRCFGSSHINQPLDILTSYSSRWGIENAIKDIIYSYYFDKCPGVENPLLVNVHFFTVTLCKTLYRMIQEDMGDDIKNSDGSIKTLKTTRNKLFRQGSANLAIENDTVIIDICNSMSQKTTDMLNVFFEKINQSKLNMKIIGGLKLKFKNVLPNDKAMKNSGSSQVLNLENLRSLG